MAELAVNKAAKWGQRLVILALIALIAYWLVKALILLFNPQSGWTPIAVNPATQNMAANGQSEQSYDFSFNPFNREQPLETTIDIEIGQDAPETTLNLKLSGLRAGPEGSAILKTPDGKEGVFYLEDEIVTGVILKAVNKDFIVINVDGQVQRLTFEREAGMALKKRSDEPRINNAPRIQSGSGNVNPGDIFKMISLKRVVEGGKLKGYKVSPNRADIKLSQFGMDSGDIVTNIAGVDLTQGRPDFQQIMKRMREQDGATITVLRKGTTKSIRLGAAQ